MDYEIKPGIVTQIDEQDLHLLAGPAWQFYGKKVFRRVYKDGKSRTESLHRLIMNPPDDMAVDHIDRNPLNNTRANLRICTSGQNSFNQVKGVPKTSRYKGVSWDKWANSWAVCLSINNRNTRFGRFKDEDVAGHEYNKQAIKYHGEFALLNPVGIGKDSPVDSVEEGNL